MLLSLPGKSRAEVGGQGVHRVEKGEGREVGNVSSPVHSLTLQVGNCLTTQTLFLTPVRFLKLPSAPSFPSSLYVTPITRLWVRLKSLLLLWLLQILPSHTISLYFPSSTEVFSFKHGSPAQGCVACQLFCIPLFPPKRLVTPWAQASLLLTASVQSLTHKDLCMVLPPKPWPTRKHYSHCASFNTHLLPLW